MADFSGLRAPDRRVTVVTGHYGSGKTEFCVSLAMRLAERTLKKPAATLK